MADPNTPTPMNDADISAPPATTRFEPAAPLKDAHTSFEPATGTGAGADAGTSFGGTGGQDSNGRTAAAKQAIKDGAGKVSQQATEKVRTFADDGKARAGSALDQLSRMLTDAASQVDEKIGGQFGQYARSAADQVSGLAETIRNKDVDELLEDARGIVRQSPAAVIGVAAALGFVAARLVHSGIDNQSVGNSGVDNRA